MSGPASSTLNEVVYTPVSSLRRPGQMAREMVQDLMASRELAWRLLIRDLRAQYRQSILGVVWSFLPPIVMAAGYLLMDQAKVIQVGATDLPYPAYLMIGMTLWQTFLEALNGPINAVGNAKAVLARVNFPREAIILAKLGEVMAGFGVKLLLIVATFIWFKISVVWTVVLAPLALLMLVLFGTFVGLFLTPFAALSQDISRGLAMVTGFWLLLTPVIYPTPQGGWLEMIVRFNPVTPLLVTTRELATTGLVSDWRGFMLMSAITLLGLIVSWVGFRLALPFVIERVGS